MTTERVEHDDLAAYRLAARTWLADNVPPADPSVNDRDPSPERVAELRVLQAKLHAAGYVGFTFPVEHGGPGLTLEHEQVFAEEGAPYGVPLRCFVVSVNILGAALLACGTAEQKRRHLPKILSGEELFLQLLSEPSGGSDLAGLLTSAQRDGDTFVVNGQKIWSTGAHVADYALCPVRTAWDVPKHKGISVLIVDLRAPGIEIRRIRQINGDAEFCEVFLNDVVVPASNLVGDENDGWRVARKILEIEHAWIGRGNSGWLTRIDAEHDVLDIVELARARGLDRDPGVRRELVALHVAIEAHKLVSERVSAGVDAGTLGGGYGNLLKLGNDLLIKRRTEVALELAGGNGVVWSSDDDAAVVHAYLSSRAASIAGGTDEIMRNNVSERVLGLPREASPDRELPFDQVPHN
jgi:alkylation response protein AidB-like acyl-CoA dehydrogenase